MKRMNEMNKMTLMVAVAALLAACGGSSKSTTRTIGPDGGGVTTPGGVSLRLAAGALDRSIDVTVSESQSSASARRIQIEPAGLSLAVPATLRVEAGDDSATARLVEIEHGVEGEVEHGLEGERHGQDGRSREAEIGRFGTFELRHGADDPADHDTGDDHGGATGGNGADDPGTGGCPAGQELDDGVCKPHGGGATPTPTPSPAPAPTPTPTTCPAGQELDASDGVCKPHGGNRP